ncbi:MAG: hypothetical protein Q8L26_08415 [Candidatus Omnitrophota bacterium]|nr:hypothetical protein [Candidatus Omnitrophota bacterium]
MDKKNFHREQAEKFLIRAGKFHGRDFLSLFEEWAESKDFSEEDKEFIFKEFVELSPKKNQILIPRLKIHLKDDPIALRDIINLIIHAIELAEKNEENDKNNLDNKGKL